VKKDKKIIAIIAIVICGAVIILFGDWQTFAENISKNGTSTLVSIGLAVLFFVITKFLQKQKK
jgi:amino acid permease